MDVTVALCTWNRAELLDRTLGCFSALRVPAGIAWELLVVNNNSTDDTDQVLEAHSRRLPLRCLFEPTPGKSRAANRAVGEARGGLILWTDDDVLVDPEWLRHYVAAAREFPRSGFFGGTIDPLFAVPPPRWIAENMDRLEGIYALRNLGAEVRLLQSGEYVYGANMAVRAELARRFPFDTQIGPNRLDQVRGEELELQNALIAAGYPGTWVGPARVRHYIPAARLTKRYLREWNRGGGRSVARIEGPVQCARLFGYPRPALKKYLMAHLGLARASFGTSKHWLECLLNASYHEGYLSEQKRLLGG